jgi:undecaprenyl-diphosphatase
VNPILIALLLGLLEGLTEFLPVSSTGHLILAGDLLGFGVPSAAMFEIVIQLGAILAICVLFARRITNVLRAWPHDPAARRVVTFVVLGFLPAAFFGALLHDFITRVLFSPYVVCAALFFGGIAILIIERLKPEPRYAEIEDFTPSLALKIGLAQCVAMIPGVSRSGATILGAVRLGVTRTAAAEYSLRLAIPTMLGAATLEIYKNHKTLEPGTTTLIAIGFAAAFVSAVLVVRWFVAFIGRHGFSVFGWYRIALAIVMLAVLLIRPVESIPPPQAQVKGQTTGIMSVPMTTTSMDSGKPSRQ